MSLLIAFMLAGYAASLIEENMEAIVLLAGVIGAIAMEVHSACGRLLLRDLAPTAMRDRIYRSAPERRREKAKSAC